MEETALSGLVLAPIIVGLVQVAKQAGLASRLAGLVSVGLGLVLGVATGLADVANEVGTDLALAIQGIIAGLAGAGLWSTGKAVSEGGDDGRGPPTPAI